MQKEHNPHHAVFYPERKGPSEEQISFEPGAFSAIINSLHKGGRLTKEQHSEISAYITGNDLDNAQEALYRALGIETEDKD